NSRQALTTTLCIFFMLCLCSFTLLSCMEEKKETATADHFRAVVHEINKMTPRKLDNITRLDSLSFTEPDILNYYYTLTPKDSVEFDWTKTRKAAMEMGQTQMDSLTSKGNLFDGRDIKLHHVYTDSVGKTLFDLTIKPSTNKKI
ncbi:MAG: hypothetical protein V4581_13480, partial [Bacteroidota bacterium]